MVIQEEKDFDDVPGIASTMYCSAIDEAVWKGLFVTEQLINSVEENIEDCGIKALPIYNL